MSKDESEQLQQEFEWMVLRLGTPEAGAAAAIGARIPAPQDCVNDVAHTVQLRETSYGGTSWKFIALIVRKVLTGNDSFD